MDKVVQQVQYVKLSSSQFQVNLDSYFDQNIEMHVQSQGFVSLPFIHSACGSD